MYYFNFLRGKTILFTLKLISSNHVCIILYDKDNYKSLCLMKKLCRYWKTILGKNECKSLTKMEMSHVMAPTLLCIRCCNVQCEYSVPIAHATVSCHQWTVIHVVTCELLKYQSSENYSLYKKHDDSLQCLLRPMPITTKKSTVTCIVFACSETWDHNIRDILWLVSCQQSHLSFVEIF